MTTYAAAARRTRRDFLELAMIVTGGFIVGRALSVPGLGDVVTGDHAIARHDLDALAVRRWYAEHASTAAILFGQPPCKDGRYRFVLPMDNGRWAIWVLQRLGPNAWQEITAFPATRDYAQAVIDDCKNGGYWGHGLYAHTGEKGDAIETTA